jgi:hypothetical protein
MPDHNDEWGLIRDVDMLSDPICPLSPEDARALFLARYDELKR